MYLSEYYLYGLPLILYAAWRIWTLIGSKVLKPIALALFAALVSSYPYGARLALGVSGPARRTLVAAAYDGMPALLYLVLTVAGVDLLIGLGRLLRIVSKDRVRSRRFRRGRLAVILLVPVAVVAGGIVNFRTVRIKEYEVVVPKRSSALDELKVVFASDFHLGLVTPPGFMDAFSARVNGLEPDIVLIGGDVFESRGGDDRMAEFEAGFKRLRARFGVYGVLGNHDGYGGGRDRFFAQAGIALLRDEAVRIDEGITLIGRNDGGYRNVPSRGRKSIDALLQDVRDDLPIILMDHRPSDIENVSRTRVDVQLSGHTHNGQIFPVNLVTKRQYLLSWGHMKKGRTDFFVTSGVQGWGPPLRTAGRSEILLVRLKFRAESPAPGSFN
jgi:predicted MPP superfamily phosphohydrolase